MSDSSNRDSSGQESFEQQFEALEKLLETLEAGELSLEDSLRHYENGQGLRRACVEKLEAAQTHAQALQSHQSPDEQALPDDIGASAFEAEMKALEQLVERLEQDELPLADGLAALEEGLKRGRTLQRTLDKAEQSVQRLLSTAKAGEQLEEFKPNASAPPASR